MPNFLNRSIVLLLFFGLLSGCWDNKDINHRVMPVVLGIASEKEDYKVYLKIPMPQKDKIEVRTVSGTGRTINEIINDLSKNLESSVDLLHVKVIVLEKDLAKKGVKDLFSGFMRARDVSPRALVTICEDDLDKFFTEMEQHTNEDGTIILDFFEKNAGWVPQIALTSVWQVYRSIHSYTHDIAIPLIRLGQSTELEQVGSAVIKNGRMVDEINSDETLLYNAFNGESTHGKIEVLNSGSVLILGNTMKHKSKFVDKKAFLQSNIKLKVMILETKGSPTISSIKKELEDLLTARFQEMFTALQENESDILGLGQLFRNEIPRDQLKDWRSKYYSTLQLNLKVEVDVQDAGNLKTPID